VADSAMRSLVSKPAPFGGRDNLHFQASPLLLVGSIGGAVSTVAVVISGILAAQPGGGPGGGPPGGGSPPPPPSTAALVALVISAAFFVISWVTVAVAVARDQLAQRIATTPGSDAVMELQASIEQIRVEAATDRANALRDLMTHLESFGEQRETEGYLNAMRAAAGAPATNGDVRFLRRLPPPES
jgi:hypothetical protein